MIRSVATLAAFGLLAVAGTANAADKPPRHPPHGSSGGATGSSGGGKPTPVPEPEQMALFALGVAGLVGGRWAARRRRAD